MDENENEQVEAAQVAAQRDANTQAHFDYLEAQKRDAEYRAKTGELLPIDVKARKRQPLGQADVKSVSIVGRPFPTPSLDPRVVAQGIDNYEEHETLLAPTVSAYTAAYSAIEAIFKARAAVADDASMTPAAQVLRTAAFADTLQTRATQAFDSAHRNLTKFITACENQLSAPLIQEAGRGTVNDAIRAHVAALKESQRVPFIMEAIAKGDYVTATATLGAVPYLSGLTDDMQGMLTRAYHQAKSPDTVSRLTAMKKAQDLLERGSGLLMKEVTRAIGADWDKVNKLKLARSRSEQALVIHNIA